MSPIRVKFERNSLLSTHLNDQIHTIHKPTLLLIKSPTAAHQQTKFMESKGFEINTGDDNCENFNGNGMPYFSPLPTTFYRWPLRDISNLFCFEVGDIVEPRGSNTPARRADGDTSFATSAQTNAIISPSMSNSQRLRRGFR